MFCSSSNVCIYITVCDWHPCLNGGTCVVDDVGYHCECTDCWTGSCCNGKFSKLHEGVTLVTHIHNNI